MRDQRPCGEFRSWREFLDDPLTRLVMKADRVPAAQLERLCVGLARRKRFRRREPVALALAAN